MKHAARFGESWPSDKTEFRGGSSDRVPSMLLRCTPRAGKQDTRPRRRAYMRPNEATARSTKQSQHQALPTPRKAPTTNVGLSFTAKKEDIDARRLRYLESGSRRRRRGPASRIVCPPRERGLVLQGVPLVGKGHEVRGSLLLRHLFTKLNRVKAGYASVLYERGGDWLGDVHETILRLFFTFGTLDTTST